VTVDRLSPGQLWLYPLRRSGVEHLRESSTLP